MGKRPTWSPMANSFPPFSLPPHLSYISLYGAYTLHVRPPSSPSLFPPPLGHCLYDVLTLRWEGVLPSTEILSEIGTKLRDLAVGQAGVGCYYLAKLSSNYSKTRYRLCERHGAKGMEGSKISKLCGRGRHL